MHAAGKKNLRIPLEKNAYFQNHAAPTAGKKNFRIPLEKKAYSQNQHSLLEWKTSEYHEKRIPEPAPATGKKRSRIALEQRIPVHHHVLPTTARKKSLRNDLTDNFS